METKNIAKIFVVSIIAAALLAPAVASVNTSVDVDLQIKGGLQGIRFTAINNEEWSVEVTYRVVGKTLLNTSNYYDITNTTEIDAESTETFPAEIPGDFAIVYVELSTESGKIYKYGAVFSGIAILLWSDF